MPCFFLFSNSLLLPLDLHFYPILELHIVSVILDHNVVEIPDDQVIVKAYHSAIPDHPFRYCVPCSLEEFFIMMDGALFSFLDPLDLVAMMGNILDNAIEASEKCAKEKRFIRLRSAQRAGLVLLSAENSCLEQLRVSSLPGTDKADREILRKVWRRRVKIIAVA